MDVDEITGTLVQHMRFDLADVLPENEILQRAKRLGISHLIKKVKTRQVVCGFDEEGSPIIGWEHEIEGYSAQEAAKQLTKVFGLKNLPDPKAKAERDFNAAVERIMQQAITCGVTMPNDELRKNVENRLKRLYPILETDANN